MLGWRDTRRDGSDDKVKGLVVGGNGMRSEVSPVAVDAAAKYKIVISLVFDMVERFKVMVCVKIR